MKKSIWVLLVLVLAVVFSSTAGLAFADNPTQLASFVPRVATTETVVLFEYQDEAEDTPAEEAEDGEESAEERASTDLEIDPSTLTTDTVIDGCYYIYLSHDYTEAEFDASPLYFVQDEMLNKYGETSFCGPGNVWFDDGE